MKTMTAERKEKIIAEMLKEVPKRRHFDVATAFYWLKGDDPGMTIKDAVEIVDEMCGMKPYPFADF